MTKTISNYFSTLIQLASDTYDTPPEKINLIQYPITGSADDPVVECALEFGATRRIVLRESIFDAFKSYSLEVFKDKIRQSFLRNPESFELSYLL